MRKKLRECTWLQIAKKDSNPSDTLKRLGEEAIRAINDLALLANRLPNDKQTEIFSEIRLKHLVNSVFAGSQGKNDDVSFNNRIVRVATLLVDLGIELCIDQYRSKIEPNSVLNEPIITHLAKTQDICEVIASKVYSPIIKSKIDNEYLNYLFDWDKIEEIYDKDYTDLTGDNKELIDFVIGELPSPDRIEYIEFGRNGIRYKCITEFFWQHPDSEGYLELVEKDMCVNLFRFSESGNRLVTTLPVRLHNGHRHVFIRKGDDSLKLV
jgi:hypothetical protein